MHVGKTAVRKDGGNGGRDLRRRERSAAAEKNCRGDLRSPAQERLERRSVFRRIRNLKSSSVGRPPVGRRDFDAAGGGAQVPALRFSFRAKRRRRAQATRPTVSESVRMWIAGDRRPPLQVIFTAEDHLRNGASPFRRHRVRKMFKNI